MIFQPQKNVLISTMAAVVPSLLSFNQQQISVEYLVYKTVYWIETNALYQMEYLFDELNKSNREEKMQHKYRSSLSSNTLAAPKKSLEVSDLINLKDKCFRRRPLYSASSKGFPQLVRYLIEKGARLNDLNEVCSWMKQT